MGKFILSLKIIVILIVIGIMFLSTIFNFAVREYPATEYRAIYIRPNGLVEPASTPISCEGNLYTLEADIEVERLVIEKSKIILDGNGFSINIVGPSSKGGLIYGGFVQALNLENSTLRNLRFTDRATIEFVNCSFCKSLNNSDGSVTINNSHDILVSELQRGGVYLENSHNCNISSSSLGSVILESSNHNMILGNEMTSIKMIALTIEDSSGNLFFGNRIERALKLLEITGESGGNLFVGNYVRGAFSFDPILDCSGVNTFYHNNFYYVYWNKTLTATTHNFWDNGFEGNYWNDYEGVDGNGDGLGDTPHLIDVNNQDRYPLMERVDLSLEPQPPVPK